MPIRPLPQCSPPRSLRCFLNLVGCAHERGGREKLGSENHGRAKHSRCTLRMRHCGHQNAPRICYLQETASSLSLTTRLDPSHIAALTSSPPNRRMTQPPLARSREEQRSQSAHDLCSPRKLLPIPSAVLVKQNTNAPPAAPCCFCCCPGCTPPINTLHVQQAACVSETDGEQDDTHPPATPSSCWHTGACVNAAKPSRRWTLPRLCAASTPHPRHPLAHSLGTVEARNRRGPLHQRKTKTPPPRS